MLAHFCRTISAVSASRQELWNLRWGQAVWCCNHQHGDSRTLGFIHHASVMCLGEYRGAHSHGTQTIWATTDGFRRAVCPAYTTNGSVSGLLLWNRKAAPVLSAAWVRMGGT